MLEVREITTAADVDFDGAEAITITGALTTDEFTVLSVQVSPGSTGSPVDAADEINIDGLEIDGARGIISGNTNDDITANGFEILTTAGIAPITGNIIAFEMSPGVTNPTDGETLSITAKILIRNSAANPIITTE